MSGHPWRRLGAALAVSAIVHAGLFGGIPVTAPRGNGSSTLRLQATLRPPPARAEPSLPTPLTAGSAVPEAAPAPAPERVAPAPAPAPVSSDEVPPVSRAPDSGPPLATDELPAPSAEPIAPPRASDRDPSGPALEVPILPDTEYYPARRLDVLPRPVQEVPLRYPDSAAFSDVSGTVTLLLLIDETGIVTDAQVLSADPPGYFEEAAAESFRGTLFVPGQREGRAVRSRLAVEVNFDAGSSKK